MQRLQAPTVFDQAARQPVEQFGVRGTSAQPAKVAGCIDEADAEMRLPHAVGQDARRERIPGRHQPARERQSALGFGSIGRQLESARSG